MPSLTFLVGLATTVIACYVAYKYVTSDPDVINDPPPQSKKPGQEEDDFDTRDIVAKMARNKKNAVVFYGSQTGTAEDFAGKLAKELSSRLGLKSMVADPEDYDLENLNQLPEKNLVIFIMASYGEGEPTDNAVDMFSFLQGPNFSDDEETIPNVTFSVFGLGNSSYELFNKIGRDTHKLLLDLEAKPMGPYGEGDDGTGTLEEDFMSWKDELFNALTTQWGLTEREPVYEPSILVEECDLTTSSPDVYVGEPNLKHLTASKAHSAVKGPFTQSNPLIAKVKTTREMFKNTDRNCIHMELDTTGIRYITGDHVAFWPQNSNVEVDNFKKAFNIVDGEKVFKIKILDSTSSIRLPNPTTYDAAIRYHLEINGAVSRQVLASIAPFAPNQAAKEKALRLASDKVAFANEVTAKYYNIASLMLMLSDNQPWVDVPFNFVLETIAHLQPRYYSISSSSLETPSAISITAVVERQQIQDCNREIKGVATNNILAMHNYREKREGINDSYHLEGPRHMWRSGDDDVSALVHVRSSTFKLPAKADLPIIMIGPGTGVAPFRGFIHERIAQEKAGKSVGPAMLFYGSRTRDTDFLYEEEWANAPAWLEVITAFSRESAQKVYVQHRLKENAAKVNELIQKGAVFYVCGDASRMARDVHTTLIEIVQEQQKCTREEAETVVRKMKSRDKYQEDVW